MWLLIVQLWIQAMAYDRNISPVGWYIGSYLSRFIELEATTNDDLEARFPTWENTVIVKAKSLGEAYDKVEAIGLEHAETYEGGDERIPVQWEYLGLTDLLPIYENLEDGAEVMWSPRHPRKLKNLMTLVRQKQEFLQ